MAQAKALLLRFPAVWLLLLGFGLAALFQSTTPLAAQAPDQPAQKEPAPKPKPKAKKAPALLETLPLDAETVALTDPVRQLDFPRAAVDSQGTLWVSYLEYEGGTEDVVMLARKVEGSTSLDPIGPVTEAGVNHQPALAIDSEGTVWCFWGRIGANDVMELQGRPFANGAFGETVTLSKSAGSDSFADAGTDAKGRVWVTWQSMRNGQADVFARYLSPTGEWSQEWAIATSEAGEWEPRLSFDGEGNAWIIWDTSAGNEFNLQLARVTETGAVENWPIAHSPHYEARPDLIPTAEGDGFWIAAERGRVRWGLDLRGHGNAKGLNAQKEILFGKFEVASKSFTEIPLGAAGKAGDPVNLPTVGVDAEGRPWVAYRYFHQKLWRVAATRFDPATGEWSARRRLPDAPFGQDRRAQFVSMPNGSLELCYTSDLRVDKTPKKAGLYVATLPTKLNLPPARSAESMDLTGEPFAESQKTPERPAKDRHSWTVNGTEYKLYWGDLHRHTDVSNCRTGFDGCIVEHFRYAYDMAKLDFMGTTDHTDVGKKYDPYEWWHNQRMHDALHSPGHFNSLYVYEREQRWPWGHRNIVFAQRGGPVVYINRTTYRNSPWQEQFPVKPGVNEIHPTELWDILERYGKPATSISHTGATGMGTDWTMYEEPIDMELETSVEIYQGARVSYEGLGVPQPTPGLRPGEAYTANSDGNPPKPPAPITDFGKFNPGVYQNALAQGHRLGVFASSDHISQHVSYGGVYCKEFTREGIIEGFQARRTIAATDKIYVDFTCDGQPMGSTLSTSSNPVLWLRVDGTAPLKRITIVRNEEDWKVMDKIQGTSFETEVTDEAPLEGANRYYLRIEQEDGNMAWASPVWVTYSS